MKVFHSYTCTIYLILMIFNRIHIISVFEWAILKKKKLNDECQKMCFELIDVHWKGKRKKVDYFYTDGWIQYQSRWNKKNIKKYTLKTLLK